MLTIIGFAIAIVLTLFLGALISPLPISDVGNVRYKSLPVMIYLLIIVNSLGFMIFQGADFYQGIALLQQGDFSGEPRIMQYVTTIWSFGYREVFMRQAVSIGAAATFTSMFMHADMWHLLGNMIYLWAFGRRVEDSCGPWRFLVFYLIAGMVANIGSTLLNPSKVDIPGIGASGAIAGVMGAYLVLFPGQMVTSFWGIGIVLRALILPFLKLARIKSVKDAPAWRWTIQLPGWFLLIAFLLRELLPSLEAITRGKDYDGVNNLAHVTGFLSALLILLFVRKDVVTRYFSGRRI